MKFRSFLALIVPAVGMQVVVNSDGQGFPLDTSEPGQALIQLLKKEPEEHVDDPEELDENIRANPKYPRNSDVWQGTQWFGDEQRPCYPGDSKRHRLKIGVIVDRAAMMRFPNWEERIKVQVLAASTMYENQLNIELAIDWLLKFDSDHDAPDLFKSTCPGWSGDESGSMKKQLEQVKAYQERADNSADPNKKIVGSVTAKQFNEVATVHVFTGCDNDDWGVIGLATKACMATPTGEWFCSGVNNLKADWDTFGHELSHNLGAGHSFEDGKYETGGLMDYGVYRKIQNAWQFNEYRKCEICTNLQQLVKMNKPWFQPVCGELVQNFETYDAPSCDCEDHEGLWLPCSSVRSYCNTYGVFRAACGTTCSVKCDLPPSFASDQMTCVTTTTTWPEGVDVEAEDFCFSPSGTRCSNGVSDGDSKGETGDSKGETGDSKGAGEGETGGEKEGTEEGCGETERNLMWKPFMEFSPGEMSKVAKTDGQADQEKCKNWCKEMKDCHYFSMWPSGVCRIIAGENGGVKAWNKKVGANVISGQVRGC